MYYTVPCGKCYECQRDKQDSYSIRAYAEYRATAGVGGLSYVDCLTYDDEHLPHHGIITELPVFNKKDIQNFLKRLSIRLLRLGYFKVVQVPQVDKDGYTYLLEKKIVPLKYFCSSEYGGQTHRPHMHFLFFFGLPISPELFEKLIRMCWTLGINDRYKKDGSLKTPYDKVINGHGAFKYVAKYVIKDDDFVIFLASLFHNKYYEHFYLSLSHLDPENVSFYQKAFHDHSIDAIRIDQFTFDQVKVLRETVESIYNAYFCDLKHERDIEILRQYYDEPVDFRKYHSFKEYLGYNQFQDTPYDQIAPFHLQSNGFGISLADKFVTDEHGNRVYNRGYVQMYKDNMYTYVDENHVERHVKIPQYIRRKMWYSSYKDFDGSIHWVLNSDGLAQRIDRLNKSIDDLSLRYDSIRKNLTLYTAYPGKVYKLHNYINYLLGSSSLHDFATYLLVYRGRLVSDKSVIPDMYELFSVVSTMTPESIESVSVYKDSYLDSSKRLYGRFMHYKEFCDRLYADYAINQDSFDEFHNFDRLYTLFTKLQKFRNNTIELVMHDKYVTKQLAKLNDPRYIRHELNNYNHRLKLKETFAYDQ